MTCALAGTPQINMYFFFFLLGTTRVLNMGKARFPKGKSMKCFGELGNSKLTCYYCYFILGPWLFWIYLSITNFQVHFSVPSLS